MNQIYIFKGKITYLYCATSYLKAKWLKLTINIYYLSEFLWVRNTGVPRLGGCDLESFIMMLSGCR